MHQPSEPHRRGERGTLLVDAYGLPLDVAVSGANRHGSMLVEPISIRRSPTDCETMHLTRNEVSA